MTVAPPASRNAPCPCGSGQRYKYCHGRIDAPAAASLPTAPAASLDAEALFRLGNACRERGESTQALEHYRRALDSAPANAALLNNIGLVHESLGDASEAADFFARALAAEPRHPAALANLAQNYYRQKRDVEALAIFDRLIAAHPGTVAAIWANRGVCLARMGDFGAAAASFERAIVLEPDSLGVRLDAGNAYVRLEQPEPALAQFEAALSIDPACRVAEIGSIALKQQLVLWDGFAAQRDRILHIARGIDDEPAQYLSPFAMLILTDDPALQLRAARSATRHATAQVSPLSSPARRQHGARLRLGFVSSDFRDHPVGRLIVGLLEHLDRESSEAFVYSVGPERSGAINARIARAADRFAHLGFGSGDALARSIRGDAVDVLFDLNGYSELQLLEAFARRPAGMQVNFLGYTGTLGCSAYDYILADRYCIPAEAEGWYAERVLRVDPCYLPSDSSREISAEPLHRASYGLPDNARVLCCFAPAYKILPDFLDGLQPILRSHTDAVLWLRHAEADVAVRIRAEAQARGIAARQIVFAPTDATARYLARFRLADLFIDTFPFGAHTTVNDALFAGLPVLAVAGRSFASRASASQVHAAGLPDFVSESVAEHFTKLRALLEEPRLVAEGRRRLQSGAANAVLFDLDRYARTFERVVREAWDAHPSGHVIRNAAS